MRTSKHYSVAGLVLSFAWVLAGGCGASTDGAAGARGGSDADGSLGGAPQGEPVVVATDAGDVGGGMLTDLNPLCGVGTSAGTCVPDKPRACRAFMPPVEMTAGAGGVGGEPGMGMSAGGAGGVAGEPGAAGHAGLSGEAGGVGAGGAGASAGGQAGVGGTPDDAGGQSGQAGQGGEGQGNSSGLASYSCQVTRQDNQLVRQCVTAGTGAANAPCFSAGDCAPSLACVTEGDVGRCRPYCCDRLSECDLGAYCADRPLRKASTDTSLAEPPRVPVCVPADNCSLEEQFPCPAGSDCRCKGNTACMVVRNDGTTTCLEPGTGQQGDACGDARPCAWNHVCSSLTNQCLKICRTDSIKDECGVQRCQASSELPMNFGVCVGPLK